MRSRMLARVGAAAAIAALLGGAVVTALPAEAAAPNPWATAKITLTEDGTGQGTSSATFVNTANGFFPGDDTATDGVVSSGDTVTYEVVVQFSASSARSVDLALTLPPYLEWPSSVSDQLCKNGYFITAERSGNTCRYTIPAGAVETLRAPLVLTAKDTAGMAINNQQVTAGIGVSGQGTYATASARAVTVVSAPAADVILTQPPAIALDYLNRITDSAALAAWSGPATGTFVATPVPLKYAGYATTKGASTAGAWFGYLDVSAFPAGTVWTVDGASTPVVNGMVAIPPTSGPATFTFTVPGGWPEQPEGTQVDYPARVIVDPSSFAAAGGLRNNGTGWQPGDGYDAGVSTLDASVGSQAGKPYPNNDFSAVRVYRDLPPGPENWFRKQVHGPYSAGNSIWETANLQITEGSQIVDRTFYPAGGGLGQYGVAPGAELDAVLIMHTDLASSAPEGVDSVLIVGDVWDPSEQAYDASRGSIIVTGPGGVIDPVYYRLEWTDQEVTSEQLLDPASTGWIGGEPTSAARAVRLVFAPDVIPTGSQDGAGLFQVFLPISIPAPSLSADSSQLLDTGAGAIIGTDTPAVDFPAAVLLRQPPTPKLGIVNQITDPWGGGNIATGARVTYQVTAAIDGVPDTSAPLAPTITVELDRCVLNPVNTSIGWAMTVTPAVPDPVSGTVCEGENSVPATLTFTPLAPYTPTWTNRLTGTATLGTISYTVQVADIAAMSMSVTNIATIGIDEEGVADAQQSKDFTVTYRQNDAAALEALVQKVEISQDLTWRAEIYSIDGTIDGAGGSTDTVITLPRNNDSLLVDDLDCDPGQCDGPLASQYQGTYILASASFDLENTTDRAVLYYTTDPVPGLTPGALEWLPLAADDHDSWKSATALRVVMTAGDTVSSAVLNITLTPSSNEPGDAYVMWIGDTSNENSEETSQPCPKAIEVVASTISGTVWWDGNSDGVQNHSEAGIAGVTVTLHEDDGGSPGEEVASTTTNGDGFYEFDLLNSGQYLVVAQRGTQIPDSVETYYGRAKPIAATYAYLSRFGPKAVAAGDQSTVITLGVGAVQPDVDFGYAYPQPMVAFDKTEATITCAAGICEVAWDLVVTNQGNTALDDLTIYDRLPAEAIDPTIAAVIPAGFKQIAANSYNAWAITDDGVWGWGYNYNTWPTPNSPPLGDGSGSVTPYSEATEYLSPTRITTLDGRNVASIVANNTNAWAITDDGVWGWGLNTTVNPLGDGDPGTARLTPVRISVLDGKTVYSIVATEYNSWAITDDGLWGWGANTAFNPLGDGSGSPQSSPVRITGLDGLTVLGLTVSANKTISTTATGSNSAWAITDDGVWGWGPNTTTYPLGAGAAGTAQPTPVPLTGLDGKQVASITASLNRAWAITDDGVWGWGVNTTAYPLGDGSTTRRDVPVPLAGLNGKQVLSITSATSNTWAITDAGVWGWGQNSAYFPLGDGATGARTSPVPITGLNGKQVQSITTATNNTWAVTDDGVWAWGFNGVASPIGDGSLGSTDASSNPQARRAPIQLTDLASVTVVSITTANGQVSGNYPNNHTWAVTSAGQVWGWGDNSGQFPLGDGPLPPWGESPIRPTPVAFTLPAIGGVFERLLTGWTTVVDEGATILRSFWLPTTLDIGESTRMTVTTRFLQSQGVDKVVVNQAWVDGEDTPISGLLPEDQPQPDPPTTPAVEEYDPSGVPGNPTCNTDADLGGPTPEDSCDQVPALIPAAEIPLAVLEGYTWVDLARDGLRDVEEPMLPGVTVEVYRDGTLIASGVTDGSGYYRFELPPGDVVVQFGISQLSDATTSYAYTLEGVAGDPNLNSDAHPDTGQAAATLYSGQTTQVDAGVVTYGPAITVVKGSDLGEDVLIQVPPGSAPPAIEVTFTVTNIGDEPLTGLAFDDETLAGPEVAWASCTGLDGDVKAALTGVTLQTGEAVTCSGLLTLGGEAGHQDVVTVTGRGTRTSRLVSDDDDWQVAVEVVYHPALTVTKTSLQTSPMVLLAGQEAWPVSVRFIIENTGDEALEGLSFDDVTVTGPVVDWQTCGAQPAATALAALTLPPGGRVTCYGTLDMGAADRHVDTVTVNGVGTESGTPASDHDDWSLDVTSMPTMLPLPDTGGYGSGPLVWLLPACGLTVISGVLTWRRIRRQTGQ